MFFIILMAYKCLILYVYFIIPILINDYIFSFINLNNINFNQFTFNIMLILLIKR